MRRFALSGAVLVVWTVLWSLTPQRDARQRGPTARRHVKSTFTFNEPTPVGEFGEFDIDIASTDSDNAVTFLMLPAPVDLPAEPVSAENLIRVMRPGGIR